MSKPSKGRILVIDDSEVLLARIRGALVAAGYEVVATAQTVGTAKWLQTADMVIVDFHMPGFDGKAVLGSLRGAIRNTDTEHAPLFYLYTNDTSAAQEWSRLGFDGVFTRKGDDRALVEQVDAAFRMKRLRGLASKLKV